MQWQHRRVHARSFLCRFHSVNLRLHCAFRCLHFCDRCVVRALCNRVVLQLSELENSAFVNGMMDKTLIFKANLSPISSLRRRSSCYNIQRAEDRDRRKSAKFDCASKNQYSNQYLKCTLYCHTVI